MSYTPQLTGLLERYCKDGQMLVVHVCGYSNVFRVVHCRAGPRNGRPCRHRKCYECRMDTCERPVAAPNERSRRRRRTSISPMGLGITRTIGSRRCPKTLGSEQHAFSGPLVASNGGAWINSYALSWMRVEHRFYCRSVNA